MQLNPHYAELNESYLFSTIAHKVADYQKAHPEADVIRLGIGDVTLPLAASVTEAMHKAVEEQGHKGTFHGYIPSEQGYEFLRDAIRRYYAGHGVELDMSEIFISDGAKSDLGNLLDLFSQDNTILVPDPVYPVYVDDNVMAGRKILYLPATAENVNTMKMQDKAKKAREVEEKAQAQALADYLRGEGAEAHSCETVQQGMEKALSMAGPEDVVCVCGSLYMIGEARHVLGLC